MPVISPFPYLLGSSAYGLQVEVTKTCILRADSDCGLLGYPDPFMRVIRIYSLLSPYLCVS